jgi:hypothetical protein
MLTINTNMLLIKYTTITINMAPKRRAQHTEEQKKRVRKFSFTLLPHGKPPSQAEVITFAKNELGIDIDQSMVSRWTNKKHAYLDTPSSSSSSTAAPRYRHRDRPFETIELALYEWIKRMEVTLSITGAIIRTKAAQFHQRMPQYQNQEEPKWSNGWLTNFQAKYGIKLHRRHGEAGSANAINCDEEIEAIQQQLLKFALRDIYNCDASMRL